MTCKTAQLHPKLACELAALKKTAVLVSGGTDSEVLLRASVDVLGRENTYPFIAVTQFQAACYLEKARAAASHLNLKLIELTIDVLSRPEISGNNSNRCYYCKKLIYSTIGNEARKRGINSIADGTNLDDIHQDRPGLRAARELQVHHPLLRAGLDKSAIRNLGRSLGMADPERPADSCLATRIETGQPVSQKSLSLIEKMEQSARAEVKGRLRAKLIGSSVYYEYQSVDRDVVTAHCKDLQRIAVDAGCNFLKKETD